MRVFSIVGARPQFVKVAVLCRAIARWTGPAIEHRIIHTGQHYDAAMSDVFFAELEIPRPDFCLDVGSGSHGVQTGEMIKRIEPILATERPDWVILYGDTNSTLAGAVAATKLHIRAAHVEAGLRSFDRRMPEELNRVAADHMSDLLLCPTRTAMDNLAREGLAARSLLTGDVMYDAVVFYLGRAESLDAERKLSLPAAATNGGAFALATIHRAENTDNPQRLSSLLATLDRVSRTICPVLLPLHPRTAKVLPASLQESLAIEVLPPASYFQMLLLENRARLILTDSGGVQKEAYFLRRPCVTLRDQTEWVETLEHGCNVLAGADGNSIVAAASRDVSACRWGNPYGDGAAGEAILSALSVL